MGIWEVLTMHLTMFWYLSKIQPERRVLPCAGAGVFGVEMFLLEDGEILLNEVAPRPHNSGHYTIEGCATSQFEQHLRAVMGWPLGCPDLIVNSWCVPQTVSPALQRSDAT